MQDASKLVHIRFEFIPAILNTKQKAHLLNLIYCAYTQ